MKQKQIFILVILFQLLLVACGGTPIDPTAETQEQKIDLSKSENGTEASPDVSNNADVQQAVSPLNAPISPLSQPESPLSLVENVGMPALDAIYDDETGAVVGQLTFVDDNGEAPIAGVTLALAKMLKNENGNPIIASYKRSTDPRTITDEYGRFVFNDITPEIYGLILDAGMISSLLDNPSTGFSTVFTVSTDSLIDLGELQFEELPHPDYIK